MIDIRYCVKNKNFKIVVVSTILIENVLEAEGW